MHEMGVSMDVQPIRVIAGGMVAAPYGTFRAHVVIAGERIAAFSDDDGVLAEADEVIDATGLVVMAGSIDLHGHFEDPGHTEREDFHTGTMAAAAGGVTVMQEMVPVVLDEAFHRRERMAAALDVPVCDGTGVGACLAYGLFASGARTSKRGGYAWPGRDVAFTLPGLRATPSGDADRDRTEP